MSMKEVNTFMDKVDDERSILINLLFQLPWGQVKPVDFSEVDDADKLLLLITCCSGMILACMHLVTGGNRENMLQGLDALFESMKEGAGTYKADKSKMN